MPAPFPELTEALARFLDRLDAHIRGSGYAGEPIRMYLAGGLAVNYYCGSRREPVLANLRVLRARMAA